VDLKRADRGWIHKKKLVRKGGKKGSQKKGGVGRGTTWVREGPGLAIKRFFKGGDRLEVPGISRYKGGTIWGKDEEKTSSLYDGSVKINQGERWGVNQEGLST